MIAVHIFVLRKVQFLQEMKKKEKRHSWIPWTPSQRKLQFFQEMKNKNKYRYVQFLRVAFQKYSSSMHLSHMVFVPIPAVVQPVGHATHDDRPVAG